MDKRGIEEITDNTIGILMTLLFVIVAGLIIWNVSSSQACPAGYDLLDDYESNPSIVSVCGEKDPTGKIICCMRKSNALQVCKYTRESKKLDCEVLVGFNIGKICEDNTACGASTDKCSGGYCDKGICMVKDGVGGCVENFNMDGKEIIVNQDSCESEFNGVSVGRSCSEGRHCIFDLFTRNGKCRGGYSNVNIDVARGECKRLCKEFSSEFCTARFPVLSEGRTKPVNYDCYSADSPIRTSCEVKCKSPDQTPQL